ncbi:MAG: LamG-like jellyroll fold domain-containing protein, partial [Akkermansiaceae bacterium]
MKPKAQCSKTTLPPGSEAGRRRRFSGNATRFFAILAGLSAGVTKAQTLVADGRVQVSTNNANFDISVFPGRAMYNDLGNGAITLTNMLGDGTVLDYKFVGNDGGGTALTVYADGGGGFLSDPFAPSANISGGGQDWANVWVTSDPGPDFLLNPRDHMPTGTPGADRTFASAAEVDGTVDISALTQGTIYFPHGTFINNWTITVTMSGPGQPDITTTETQGGNGPGTNFGWISSFSFTGAQDYDTITYNYTNGDRDGSRARFMGVILDGPVEANATFIELAGDDPAVVERATSYTDPGVSGMTDGAGNPLGQADLDLITVDSTAVDLSVPGSYPIVYSYPGNDPLLPSSITRTVTVVDTQAPTVVLNGDASITITAGQPFVDPGATATDANDGAATQVYGSAGSPASSEATGKWTFDDDTINDSSGNGYNGSPQGNMVYSNDTPYGSGKSIDFRGGNNAFYVEDGTSDQSVFQPIPGLRPPAATDPVLVEQWVVESTGPDFTADASTADFIGTNAEIDAAVAADSEAATSSWDNINFGDGNTGRASGDSFYPRAVNNNPDNIAIRATGVLRIPVTGDYDIGFQSDDGSSLLIENTNAVFQAPLLETVGGGRIIQKLATAAVVDNIGTLGAAGDLGDAPLSTQPLLDGGDASPLFEQAGALVDPGVPGPAVSNNSLLFTGQSLDAPFNAAFNVEDADVANAVNSVTGVTTPGAASEFTVEFWAKPTANGNLLCPINNLVFNGPARNGWLFYQTPDDSWEWRVGDNAGYIDPVRAPANAFPNTYDQWNHVVGVIRLDKTDPTTPIYTSEVYVNGVLGNSAVLSRIPLVNNFTTAGGDPATVRVGATNQNVDLGPGRPYIGCLDEIAVYDTALSAAQIQAHYENGANSPARTVSYPDAIVADSPLAYWRGEEAQPAIDNSLTGLFAPANGGAQTAVGRITLAAGDYPISFISRERGGGEYCEVFAKPAAAESFDPLSFQGFAGYPIDSPITISFFAKRNGWAGNWSGLVTKRGEGGQGYQVRRRAGEQKVIFTTRGLGNDDPVQGTNTSVGDGEWHHIVAEYGGAGGNRKLWIDGVLDYDITSNGLMTPAPGFNFAVGATDNNGAPGPNLQNFYQGQMDNVCFFHRTLTDEERFGLLAGGDRVDVNTPGTYTVRYVSLDPSGNSSVATREVIVEADPAAPILTLTGDAELVIEASNDPFVDPGATVAEGPGGINPGAPLDANNIVVSGDTVDPAAPGSYRLVYNYTDVTNGTALPVERVVRVVDTTPPVITLNGPESLFVVIGEPFVDPGATATDLVSGDSPAFPSGFPGQSLLGYWSFDDPANPGKDDSGFGRDVTLGGGAVTSDASPAVGARFLNTAGGNRFATVLGGTAANDLYDMGTDSFTVATWVRGWPGASWVPFVSKRGEGGQGWQLRKRSNQTNATITTRGAGADDNPTGAPYPQDGQWHHLVGRVDRTTNEKTIWVDGVQVGDTGFLNGNQINPASAHALTFAARDNGGGSIGNFSSVDLDDIQIYRRALADSEIADLADPNTGVDVFPNVFDEETQFDITYTATDGAGNSTTVTRTVTVVPGAPFAITSTVYNDNNTVGITWNSRPGAFYTIEVSTDLENWAEIQDGYASQGEETSYTYTGGGGVLPDPDPTVNPQIFLRVSQDQ